MLAPNPPGPVNPKVPLTILGVQRSPGGFTLEFTTQKGTRYTLQESLDGASWTDVTFGTGTPESLTDSDAAQASCLYRVKATLEPVFIPPVKK